jgi:inner membrane protein COX18
VVPQLEKERHGIAKNVFDQMKADKIRGGKPFLVEYHAKKCREIVRLTCHCQLLVFLTNYTSLQLSARQKELFRHHGCQPWKTIAFPPLAQLPLFFGITMGLREISQMPNTPFDSEAFLTLTTLAHPDPTMTLPILLGLVTMANVETSNMLMTATQKAKFEEIEKKNEAGKKAGKVLVQPRKIVKEGLRGLSVVRILFASVAPGVSIPLSFCRRINRFL